ncbi:MAG: hypothetical protein RIF37_13495 [Rhodospirillaceae bacterium]|jgi:hypothetical protein
MGKGDNQRSNKEAKKPKKEKPKAVPVVSASAVQKTFAPKDKKAK